MKHLEVYAKDYPIIQENKLNEIDRLENVIKDYEIAKNKFNETSKPKF